MRYRFLVLGVLLVAGCREPKWAAEGGFEDASSDAGPEDAVAADSGSNPDAAPLEDATQPQDAIDAEDSGPADAELLDAESRDAAPADAIVAMDAQEVQVCGDGDRTGTEVWDNGGAAKGVMDCAYGASSCMVCTSSCTQLVAGISHVCGDRTTDHPTESSDDGAMNGQLDCLYTEQHCMRCSSTCQTEAGHLHYCGDSMVDLREECDEGGMSGPGGSGPNCDASCCRIPTMPSRTLTSPRVETGQNTV